MARPAEAEGHLHRRAAAARAIPRPGRVHTCFNQAVAATGRLSSSDPNLQNIPIRTEIGREIRRAFVAEPGHVLISADYSQIELRVLAHLSGDADADRRVRATARTSTIAPRCKVFGADSGLDPHELRRRAKIINYALLYGKTAFTLAKDIGVTQQEAQEFIDAYFAGFPRVRAFIDDTSRRRAATGVVKTMFGRRRLVPDLDEPQRPDARRRRAHGRQHADPGHRRRHPEARDDRRPRARSRRVAGGRARMILTVHDELLFEAPKEARRGDGRRRARADGTARSR